MSSGEPPNESGERPRSLAAKLGTLLLISALIAGVFAMLAARSQAGSPVPAAAASPGVLAGQVSINTTLAEIYCPTQAFFSPDGTTIAVLGATFTCRDTNNAASLVGHELAFYDRVTGTLDRALALDPLIGVDDHTPARWQMVRAVRYVALGWSPDGARIALAYATFDSPRSILPDDLVDTGLLLLDAKTLDGHVIHGDAGFFAASTSTYGGLPVWNLKSEGVSPPVQAPAGLAYAWSANGLPEAILPLTAGGTLSKLPLTAGSRYPVGNPDGDATYTIWQSGMLLGPRATRSVPGLQPTQDALVTIFPAWSPDGTYATLMVAGVALPLPAAVPPAAATPGPTGPILPAPQTLSQVPARDAALQAVQRDIGQQGWALVGWNPAGTELASVVCGTTGETLRMRTTESGNIAGELPVPLAAGDPGCAVGVSGEQVGDYPSPNQWLQWAQDGNALLLTDQTAGTVTVWNVR
ncbi:MAG TPA: hypothetical protein VF116_20055 [Ktedonobacterales bacterium]